jgi:hypothetical protein
LFTPGVMVTSVPWQLSSSDALDERIRLRADRTTSVRGRMPGTFDGPEAPITTEAWDRGDEE